MYAHLFSSLLFSNENKVIYFPIVTFTVGTKHNRFICDNGATLVMCDRHISNYMSTLLPLLYIKIKGKYPEMQQTLVKALSYNTKQE